MALLNDNEVKVMTLIASIWIIATVMTFIFTQASWLTLIVILSGFFIGIGFLIHTQIKPIEKKDIGVTMTYTQMQAIEECLLCDKPSQSAKSIARQWINKIRKS